LPERPPDVSLNLDDLEEQAKQIESAKAAWASALDKMKEDFSKVKEFQERDVPPEMKVTAWELFLKTFAAGNPYSQEDDQMKQEASQQASFWKAVKEPLPKPEPVEEPQKPAEARITKVGTDGATMILIPAGEFQMGSDGITSDEKPVHPVYLDAFYIDEREVTNGQYRQFVEATGHREPEGYALLASGNWRYGFKPWSDENFNGADQPVVCVTWEDAKAYCDWAGKRLPTEAEWEKAARSGLVESKYVWGEAWPPSSGAGNFADETFRSVFPNELFIADYADRYIYTSPVGSFEPNGYGLYDMAGNVWEWCADWLDGGYYKTSPGRNPTGPGSGSYRVFRGGSWLSDPNNLLVAFRQGGKSAGPYSDGGFRCVSEE
jgi:formylglycine-generating enzyme required for sulfatase activity